MEMKAHLTDIEMAEALVEPGRGAQLHLDDCESCRTELGRLQLAIRQAAREAGDRSDDFWVQQRRNIRVRLANEEAVPAHPRARWALAFGVCMLAFAIFLLYSAPAPPLPQPQTASSDHELLLEVESMVGSDVPQSLEPASLLATEISRGLPASSPKDSKKGEQE